MSFEFRIDARALRAEFDRAFAEPLVTDAHTFDELLIIRLSGHSYALRVSELAGLHADRPIVPVPSRAVELLGLVAHRGALSPVYDLGLLLGHAALHRPRWLVLSRAPSSVALAFDAFEAHVRVPQALSSAGRQAPGRGHVIAATEFRGTPYPILSIGSLLEAITVSARSYVSAKEP